MHYLIFPAYGLLPPVWKGNVPLTLPLPDVAGICSLDAQRCHLTTSFKDANHSCQIVCPRIFLDFSSTYPPFDSSGRHANCFVPWFSLSHFTGAEFMGRIEVHARPAKGFLLLILLSNLWKTKIVELVGSAKDTGFLLADHFVSPVEGWVVLGLMPSIRSADLGSLDLQ